MTWRVTPELRYVRQWRPPHRLQQLWVRDGIDEWGHVIFAAEKEWRDVPMVPYEAADRTARRT